MDELVGRDVELEALRTAIAPGRRVVVRGPPGVGKTALLRAALVGRARVVWVELDDARTREDLWTALARALHVSLADAARAATQIVRALRDAAVVALDGAELLDAEAWEALDAIGRERPEIAWVIGAVVSPPGADEVALGPLAADDAVALLARRARSRVGRAVEPDDADVRAIAERLDGLPLALELAASRLALMTPRELAQRLDAAVVRGAGRRTSVEGALRFAWGLLSEADQQALVRLSLARGVPVDLAEAMLGDDAFAVLERLRARSALAVRDGRLCVLEGLRRIALEQVDEATRAAFVAFWDRRSVALRAEARSPKPAEAVLALRQELPNLEIAFALARERGEVEAAARLALAIVVSLRTHGLVWRVAELPDLLALAEAAPDEVATELYTMWGGALLQLGQARRAREVIERATARAAGLGPVPARSLCWAERGWLLVVEGDLAGGRAAFEEALRTAPDAPTAALALNRLSTVEHLSADVPAAIRALEEALARLESFDAPKLRGAIRLNLGVLRAEQGRRVEAEDLLRAAIDDLARIDLFGRTTALFNLAWVALAFGEPDRAGPLLAEAADLDERYGSDVSHGMVLVARALERWAQGDRDAARARFVEAAEVQARVDPRAFAETRAYRAALEADSGRPESLAVELAAAEADGADPRLVRVLAAFGGGAPPPPEPIEPLEVRVARRLLERGPPALRCDRQGRWFERPGDRVDLARRGALRRILEALVVARLARPGAGLTVQELFDAGWPGERALPEAAASRVYTAVRELRALGIGEVLRREAGGYLLDPAARIDVT